MANAEHLAILGRGVEAWNQWREECPDIVPDLHGANLIWTDVGEVDLGEADLRDANFSLANLRKADLQRADLSGATFTEANLRWADLSEAQLSEAFLAGADLSGAILGGADLSGAFLGGANLSGAFLSGADFSGAELSGTIVADVDLSQVKGLDTVEHGAPCTIGIDTLYRSGGNIPEEFLRGCGVPDQFIEYARSLVGKAIEFYSCFVSHSAKDKLFCERLYADLRAKHVRVWYFPENAKWGEPVWGEIDRSIRVYDKLVVVCSENSLQSGPVNREIERALQREDREGKSVLFPIRIDDYIFDVWEHPRKADVLDKVVGDFTGWDTDARRYDKAFQRLLACLEAGG